MANPPIEKQAAVVVPEVASLTLTEFCSRLSETVRRPELIGAFESVERKAGSVRATDAVFRERFTLFSNKPV